MSNVAKTQPWKAGWHPVDEKAQATASAAAAGIEYGVAKGATVVVDGTAANVKPKTQPWKTSWPPVAEDAGRPAGVEYGVAKGEVAVVDGTAANVKPATKQQDGAC